MRQECSVAILQSCLYREVISLRKERYRCCESLNIFRPSLPVLASLLSSVLLILAFPPYSLGWLGWVALVPLLIAISTVNPRQGFVLSFICGAISFAIIFIWVFEVPGYKILHHFILGLYLGSFFGIFGFVVSFITKRCGFILGGFVAPFIFVSIEYIRSNTGFMALPYAWLGYTQYKYPPVIQIASVAGTHGVSFLLAMVNSAVAAFVLTILYRSETLHPRLNRPISNRGLASIVSAAAFFTVFTLFYGMIVVSKPIAERGKSSRCLWFKETSSKRRNGIAATGTTL